MSAARNYLSWINTVLVRQLDGKSPLDIPVPTLVKSTKIRLAVDKDGNALPGGDSEPQMRKKISTWLGKIEERTHGTRKDPETKKRSNPVPERHVAFHNRLVEDLYERIMATVKEAAPDAPDDEPDATDDEG